MSKPIGIWIDLRHAIVVTVKDHDVETTEISAHVDKRSRYQGGTSTSGGHGSRIGEGENVHEHRRDNQLNAYYDEVIGAVRSADALFLFGPGEAKHALLKRLKGYGLDERVVGIETTDKMTVPQITNHVRERFQLK